MILYIPVLFTSVFSIFLSITGTKTETDAEKANKTVVNRTGGNMPHGVISKRLPLILMGLSATVNDRNLVNSTLLWLLTSWNGNAMALNPFPGLAVPEKPWRKQLNGAGNRILNLMHSMTTYLRTSNSTNTIAGRSPVITILMTGCCSQKVQRHSATIDSTMPYFLLTLSS